MRVADTLEHPAPVPLEAACRVAVVVPDDGTDLRLMTALLNDKGIARAVSVSLRAVGVLREARTRHGRLPEPALARLVTIIVSERDAEAVFDFVCEAAKVCRPGGGVVTMDRLLAATPYALPADVPVEPRLSAETE